jgi:hypothetical protein
LVGDFNTDLAIGDGGPKERRGGDDGGCAESRVWRGDGEEGSLGASSSSTPSAGWKKSMASGGEERRCDSLSGLAGEDDVPRRFGKYCDGTVSGICCEHTKTVGKLTTSSSSSTGSRWSPPSSCCSASCTGDGD